MIAFFLTAFGIDILSAHSFPSENFVPMLDPV